MSTCLGLFYAKRLVNSYSFMVYSYIFCSCFLRGFFCTWSYCIQIILKLIYLTWTTIPSSSELGSNSNERVHYTTEISRTGDSLSHSVLYHTQDTPFFLLGVFLLHFIGHNQHILSPADRVIFFRVTGGSVTAPWTRLILAQTTSFRQMPRFKQSLCSIPVPPVLNSCFYSS